MDIVKCKNSEMTIGKTTFFITTTFSEKATETIENKLVRYISNSIASDVKSACLGKSAVKK
jgi:hypothetical protein